MILAILLLRVILAAVFLAAGLPKLFDRSEFRKTLTGFGVPDALAGPSAVLLPWLEILIGIGLIPARLAWQASIAASVLMASFIVAIGFALARGRKPDCRCFGQLHSKPIGWDLVARNLVLELMSSTLVVYGPRQPVFAGGFNVGANTLWLMAGLVCLTLLSVQCWLTFQLIQQSGRVLLRLDELDKKVGGRVPESQGPAPTAVVQGLPVGQKAPDVSFEDSKGRKVSADELVAGGKPAILVFTNPNCGPCNALMSEVAQWQQAQSAHFSLALITEGTLGENKAKLTEHGIDSFFLQKADEVSVAYEAPGTPAALLLRPDGTIGSPLATGAERIRTLVANTINESLASLVTIGLGEGDQVPALTYPDLSGQMFSLSSLRGASSILMFWNPACGYCQQMLEDVKAWERTAPSDAPALLIISAGTVEANRQLGFSSRVLLDQSFTAGRALGMGGTPSALLVDADGRIVSKAAVGRTQIMSSILRQGPIVTV